METFITNCYKSIGPFLTLFLIKNVQNEDEYIPSILLSNTFQFFNNYDELNNRIYLILGIIGFFYIADRILVFLEKNWDKIKKEFSSSDLNINSDFGDSLNDFTNLDQTIIQVLTDVQTKFADVAGNDEAKTELVEVVRFLKNPKKFIKLGATVPRGILLAGPPGTGKTLLARAIAGESGTPFLKVSGSQFVELLVGVGATRVRELFEKARELKPAIIFIDEIDSIARTRASNNTSMGGSNDEREQTLNQILTQMDGFDPDTGIVVIAATNRIDILDPAILRPGRFDRQITISNPTLKERLAILKVHSRGKRFKKGLSLSPVAVRTVGFSGADLANVLNEAAILATRRKKKWITIKEINLSIERLVLGLEGNQLLRVKSRQLVAFREMGHAIIGNLILGNDSIEKLTLISRGGSQGTTWKLPPLTQYNSRYLFLQDALITLAGRAAEDAMIGSSECTVGAQQELGKITRNLRGVVLRYAMTRLQQLKQEIQRRNLYLLGSDIKLEINNIIDVFTTNFLDTTYTSILQILQFLRPVGERVVDELLLFEELSGKELKRILMDYLSNLKQLKGKELLYSTRKSSMFSFVSGDFGQFGDFKPSKNDDPQKVEQMARSLIRQQKRTNTILSLLNFNKPQEKILSTTLTSLVRNILKDVNFGSQFMLQKKLENLAKKVNEELEEMKEELSHMNDDTEKLLQDKALLKNSTKKIENFVDATFVDSNSQGDDSDDFITPPRY
jgi:cell division protease FtsH